MTSCARVLVSATTYITMFCHWCQMTHALLVRACNGAHAVHAKTSSLGRATVKSIIVAVAGPVESLGVAVRVRTRRGTNQGIPGSCGHQQNVRICSVFIDGRRKCWLINNGFAVTRGHHELDVTTIYVRLAIVGAAASATLR